MFLLMCILSLGYALEQTNRHIDTTDGTEDSLKPLTRKARLIGGLGVGLFGGVVGAGVGAVGPYGAGGQYGGYNNHGGNYGGGYGSYGSYSNYNYGGYSNYGGHGGHGGHAGYGGHGNYGGYGNGGYGYEHFHMPHNSSDCWLAFCAQHPSLCSECDIYIQIGTLIVSIRNRRHLPFIL